MVIIIAGDIKQAERYARRVGLFENEWRYVNEINQIRGRGPINLIYTGHYWKNPLYEEMPKRTEVEMRASKITYDNK